jgi:hypothetical protein
MLDSEKTISMTNVVNSFNFDYFERSDRFKKLSH